MGVTNYLHIQSRSPFSKRYMFVDTMEHLADQVFIEKKIPVRFGDEFQRDGTKYVLITCRVKKRYVEQFEEALSALVDKMLLLGHTDYGTFCNDVLGQIKTSSQASK